MNQNSGISDLMSLGGGLIGVPAALSAYAHVSAQIFSNAKQIYLVNFIAGTILTIIGESALHENRFYQGSLGRFTLGMRNIVIGLVISDLYLKMIQNMWNLEIFAANAAIFSGILVVQLVSYVVM